ncbi:MAG: response regulator [Gammaproteobacteria bacterium]|nr:response regulator [Gammaproteobacteria bacterium]
MSRTILIVDDEPSVRKMLTKILKEEADVFLDAKNGVQAKQLCYEQDVDLMITDIVMPEKHGIDLIIEIKKEKPNLPIIAISGGGGISGRFDYLEIAGTLGVENILHKPFKASELRSFVRSALSD